jgi:hypothetical protein
LGDLDFSWNFGVSQSRAREVVEKHRDREKVASGPDKVGRVQAESGPANILICGPIVRREAARYTNVAEGLVTPALFDDLR